jgi:hypothetical protein
VDVEFLIYFDMLFFVSHRMARYYSGLELEYDREHRARFIENGLEVRPEHILFFSLLQYIGSDDLLFNFLHGLHPMRMRGHSADDMPYDVRYEPYFESGGLLPFVL